MSVSPGRIGCQQCSFEAILAYRPVILRYRLPDGSVVEGYRQFVWCSSCKDVREAEHIQSEEQIRAKLDDFYPARSWLARAFDQLLGGKPSSASLEYERNLRELLEFSRLRRSPPRCLTCEAAQCHNLDVGEGGVIARISHTCGGKLQFIPDQECGLRFSYSPEVIDLSLEGTRLRS